MQKLKFHSIFLLCWPRFFAFFLSFCWKTYYFCLWASCKICRTEPTPLRCLWKNCHNNWPIQDSRENSLCKSVCWTENAFASSSWFKLLSEHINDRPTQAQLKHEGELSHVMPNPWAKTRHLDKNKPRILLFLPLIILCVTAEQSCCPWRKERSDYWATAWFMLFW